MLQTICCYLIFTFAIIQAAPTQENDVPCICNKIYRPVCATDGKTYNNICMLECAMEKQSGLSLVKNGPCNDEANEEQINVDKENYCICTFDYNPVCGTDGRTYSNLCMLNCMRKENKEIDLAYEGECNENVCICQKEDKPVCASTLVTYSNPCELGCAQKYNTELYKIHDGKCTELDNHCKCDDKEFRPMCASDGKTYDNLCSFECAKRNQPALLINSEGLCEDEEEEDEEESTTDEQVACACTMDYKPVCGTDSKTYSNLCILNCVQRSNKDLTLAYGGECDKRICICNEMYSPICGSNGKTFANACEFECDQKWNPELRKLHDGECTFEEKENPPCICNGISKPTCGTDGETYANPCKLGCEQLNNPGLTISHFGRC